MPAPGQSLAERDGQWRGNTATGQFNIKIALGFRAMCSGDCRDMDASPDPAVLISATLYLMSCHAMNPCPRLADMVTRHLCALSRVANMPPTLKATCRELCGKWERLALTSCRPGLRAGYIAGPQTAQ